MTSSTISKRTNIRIFLALVLLACLFATSEGQDYKTLRRKGGRIMGGKKGGGGGRRGGKGGGGGGRQGGKGKSGGNRGGGKGKKGQAGRGPRQMNKGKK